MAGRLIIGDCIEQMRTLEPASIDAVVTDPPYGLEFMGKEWDSLRSRDGTKWSGEHAPSIVDAGGPTPYDRARVTQPSTRPTCLRCGRGGSGQWGRCECAQPLLAKPWFGTEQQAWHHAWAVEAFRVLKPGGHLVAFGGTRTYHRLVCAVEDAGFEIRDSINWIYGSGFPKSLNVGKAIDAQVLTGGSNAARLKEMNDVRPGEGRVRASTLNNGIMGDDRGEKITKDEPATAEAATWAGFGTALKPGHEPIVLARKPLSSTVAENVLAYGTGALNIDGCRVNADAGRPARVSERRDDLGTEYESSAYAGRMNDSLQPGSRAVGTTVEGRWPANLAFTHDAGCVPVGTKKVRSGTAGPQSGGIGAAFVYQPSATNEDGIGWSQTYAEEDGMETIEAWECVESCPVAVLDAQSGPAGSNSQMPQNADGSISRGSWGFGDRVANETTATYDTREAGGASRFFTGAEWEPDYDVPFFYCAKAGRAERNVGLGAGFVEKPLHWSSGDQSPGTFQAEGTNRNARNAHPTVKPVNLMKWLVRLVTPPGGRVLDPFLGSGTTAMACELEGFEWVGIEQSAEYAAIAEARIAYVAEFGEARPRPRVERHVADGQLGFDL